MSLLQRIMISATAALVFTLLCGNAVADVDPNCLGCMCEAATNCNESTTCHVPHAGAYFCGPFHLSWAYWADADKPVLLHDDPNKQGAFENCAQDLFCAAKTVRQYMSKFSEDCDGDGVVTCKDFVRIHKLGRSGCKAPLPDDLFTQQFVKCGERLNLF